jgi:hypothetical protein
MAILQVGAIPARKMGTLDITFRLFLRVVAFGCLVSGLQYWMKLIGFSDHGAYRFDLAPSHWRFVMASLSVLMPVAAVGLWMEVSWGAVIWVLAAGMEIGMYQLLPQWFGEKPLVLALHALVAATYIAFRLAFLVRARLIEKEAREDDGV